MPATGPEVRLFGREPEARHLDDLVERLGSGGGALLVRGETGIGKSAVLAQTVGTASARGAQLLQTVGVQSEAQLPFAGLHQLLRPLLPTVSALPTPQRDVLSAAFGLADGPVPELFFVALAALNLIGEAATRSPVLLVIDDAHWLDQSSAGALAFVARRLESEPVLLLAALRDGFRSPLEDAGLPELRLEPLGDTAAQALIDARAPDIPIQVRERLLRGAAGNPLALVELPLASEEAGEALRSPWPPLTTRLERAFMARVADLDPPTRILLLVLAADDGGLISEVLAATALLGNPVGLEELAPAITARLVEPESLHVGFRHPLMRSAIYRSATMPQRQAAHAALAEVLVEDPDRRAWHRAASIVAPAEDVASELEAMAGRAQRRGAVAVAMAGLERAAQLSQDSARRGQRLLRAAELGFELGRPDLVSRLVTEAEPLSLGRLEQSHLLWLRGVFDGRQAGGASRLGSLIETAQAVTERGDDELALKILWSAAIQCWWSDPGQRVSEHIADAAERVRAREGDSRLLAVLAFAAPLHGAPLVMERLARLGADVTEDADTARVLGTAANAVGAFDASAGVLAAAAAGLRAQGRLGLLARALTQQAWSAAYRVDLNIAIAVAAEAERLTRETAQPTIRITARAIQAMLSALRGDRPGAEAQAAQAEQFGTPIGARALLAMAQHARGLAALADGHHAEAYEHLHRLHDPGDPAYHSFMRCFTVADLVDAAVQCGTTEAVRPIVAELEALASRTPIPVLDAGLRYARPLLAHHDEAESLFDDAARSNAAWPFLRARTQLARGAWLRLRRRAAESRAPLRAARETFDALGTIPWSERAREQLRASGETSRRRVPEARDQLTPQELQIAQMAASGLSNPEIGQRLYISRRTVSSHLYRIFPKLGITSRLELDDAITGRAVRARSR